MKLILLGAPGAGKTCTQRLLLNKDPPKKKLTNSTPIARPAVKATRISCSDGGEVWEAVEDEVLLESLVEDMKSRQHGGSTTLVDEFDDSTKENLPDDRVSNE